LLYSVTNHLISNIIWDHDWIHFGTGKDINRPLINSIINEFFDDEFLYFVQKRNNSMTYRKCDINIIIDSLLGQSEFQLWNISMDRVIRFDEIGVLQLGKVKQKDLKK
jgi:hypothetical protein